MLYSCTNMATVGVRWVKLTLSKYVNSLEHVRDECVTVKGEE